MTSSAAGTRRSFLRRPKVCKTPPNPGRCEKPPTPELPPRTCFLGHEAGSDEPGDAGNYFVHACAPLLLELELVNVVLEFPEGIVEQVETVANCDPEDADGNYNNPEEEGDFVMTATFTWSDTGTCIETTTIHVEEENGDDE